MRPENLDADVQQDCPHPAQIAHGGDWEIYAGRLGDELLACRLEKRVAVGAHKELVRIISPR